jgi:PHD/YefM family antitoxin component YafN of YafNO toxin-antitoxin module
MKALPTVTIDRDGKAVIINESDFRADSMKLFGEKPAAKPKAAPKKARKTKAES